MSRYLPIAGGIVVMVIFGILQGVYTERWHKRQVTRKQQEFAARIKFIPESFGDWDSRPDSTDQKQLERAGAVGHLARVYTNRHDKTDEVSVFLICGHSYDIADHMPDQCYVCQGYQMPEDPHRFVISDPGEGDNDFFNARFRKETIEGVTSIRLFWAWNTGRADGTPNVKSHWDAPTIPRVAFEGREALFKLYVISNKGVDGAPADSPNVKFLRAFMPELEKALFEPESKPETITPEKPAEPVTAKAA